MYQIPLNKHLHPYYDIALQEAKKSPCVRRKYGAVIVEGSPEIDYVAKHNERMGFSCNQYNCIREQMDLPTDGRHISVELGAEIHAEVATLLAYGKRKSENTYFVLAGIKGDRSLIGRDSYPCYLCALAIKYAGFTNIYLRTTRCNDGTEINPVSIAEIIRYREAETEPIE